MMADRERDKLEKLRITMQEQIDKYSKDLMAMKDENSAMSEYIKELEK